MPELVPEEEEEEKEEPEVICVDMEEWAWSSGGLQIYPMEAWDEVWDRHARNPKGDLLRRQSLLRKVGSDKAQRRRCAGGKDTHMGVPRAGRIGYANGGNMGVEDAGGCTSCLSRDGLGAGTGGARWMD